MVIGQSSLEVRNQLNGRSGIKMNQTQYDFLAELKFRASEEGGRTTEAHNGYRPGIRFPFDEMQTSGYQEYIGQVSVSPGETVLAKITIMSPAYFVGKLQAGMSFNLLEGSTLMRTGRIEEILNPPLISDH